MARIRSVHPSLFTDEAWVSCSPLARILYIGLWTDADDQGLFEWKPLQLKMRLLPGDAGDCAAMLAEIESAGLICRFQVGDRKYGAIKGFRKFQRPQKPNAIHPLPENMAEYVGISPTAPAPVPDQYDTPPVEAQPMEDGGGRVEEMEASLPVAADAAPEAVKTEVWDSDASFLAVWGAATPEMRKRAKSRRKTWPEWLKAKRRLSPEDLLGAVRRYVREDPDVKRTGGPGLHLWLKDGTYENWLGSADAPAIQAKWAGPEALRKAVVLARGDSFARSYLDPCFWSEDDSILTPRTAFGEGKLRQEVGSILSQYGVRIGSPEAVAA